MRVIVTGGNSGVGRATATALAAAGHQVVIACRSLSRGLEAAATMEGDVEVRELDLADLASVQTFTDTVDGVDVLINNAGVLVTTTLPDGTYLAPRGPLHRWGPPRATTPMRKARDEDTARRLWKLSEELTGCTWQG